MRFTVRCIPLALLLSVACGDDDPVAPESVYEGVFQIAQTNEATTCSPEPLPAPAVEGSENYFVPPEPGWDGGFLSVRVTQTGNSLDIVPLDEAGTPLTFLTFEGTIQADGTVEVSRFMDLGLEDEREAGHHFFLQERATITQENLSTDGSQNEAEGQFETIFRSDSAEGEVFTTCTTPFTSTGTRISD